MPDFLASEVSVEEESPQIITLAAARTAVIGIIGTSQMGPIGEVIECNSWQDYLDNFGGHDADATLPNQVRMLYKQDRGATVKVARTVHYSDVTDPTKDTAIQATVDVPSQATAASAGAVTGSVAGTPVAGGDVAWSIDHNDTLDIHCDEDGAGPDTATFTGTTANLAGGATALPVTIGHTVTFTCDAIPGTQVITYSAGHAVIEDVAEDINAQIRGFRAIVVGAATIDFESDTLGNDSTIAITAETGTGATDIGHAVPSNASGGGNVGNLDFVTYTEFKTIVEAAVVNPVTGVTVSLATGNFLRITSNTTGALSAIQVENTSIGADTALGLDNVKHDGSAAASVTTLKLLGKYEGDYAHDLRGVFADASNGDAVYFNLRITDDEGSILETFPNVQVATPADDDWVENIVNKAISLGGSKYVAVEDQLVAIRPENATLTPAGGDDGLTGLVDIDFLGDTAGGTGIHAFDLIQELTLFADGGRATSAWQNGLVSYCESDREGGCLSILDPPAGLTAAAMVTYADVTASLVGSSEFGAIYWPRIKILNPTKAVYGNDEQLTVAPSGAICGLCSRNDSAIEGGVYKQPAGLRAIGGGAARGAIVGAQALETEEVKDIRKRKVVFPKRINPISQEPGTKIFIDGEYVLRADANFPTVAERRGVIFINTSVKNGLQFVRHENHDEDLRMTVRRTVRQFLLNQMKIGAFRYKDEERAFWLVCDESINPPSIVIQNKLYLRYALATQKPAIWVVINVSQDTRDLEEETT